MPDHSPLPRQRIIASIDESLFRLSQQNCDLVELILGSREAIAASKELIVRTDKQLERWLTQSG